MAARRSDIASSIKAARPLAELATRRPEFAHVERIWDNELAPRLGEREAVRKQAVSKAIRKTVVSGVLALIIATVIYGVIGAGDFFFPLLFFLVAVVVAAVSGMDWLKVYSLKGETKDLVLGTACRLFGFTYQTLHPDLSGVSDLKSLMAHSKELAETLTGPQIGDARTFKTIFGDVTVSSHDGEGGPPPTPAFQILKDAALLPGYAKRKFEDLIEGERAGAKFSLVEVRLDSGGKNSQTVFQGILVHVEFPERFLGRTVMARSGWWKRGKGAGELKKVDLISKELMDAFTVYSNDQVEARAILAPDRMERLIALERHFSGGKLRGVFESGHMTIALEAPDQFEAGSIFEPLVDPRRFSSALSELGLLCDLIDGFLTRDWVKGRL
ncbi:MAG: DUF3137 domain-containing protein [Hyphomonas sp.]|uniref:DUF3137 domain-containing protein n=1 Tax=Hyphomonas sp. TaxID=87 RepID=UPI003528DDA1